MKFPLSYSIHLWHGTINDSQLSYRQNANITSIKALHVCEQAERASLAGKCSLFAHSKTAFSFNWYSRYFVGMILDMLVGLDVPDIIPNVPTKLRKGIMVGAGGYAPSPSNANDH